MCCTRSIKRERLEVLATLLKGTLFASLVHPSLKTDTLNLYAKSLFNFLHMLSPEMPSLCVWHDAVNASEWRTVLFVGIHNRV